MRNMITATFDSAIQSRWFNSNVANWRIHTLTHNETNELSLLEHINIPQSSNFVEEVIAAATAQPEILDLYHFEQIYLTLSRSISLWAD